MDYLSYKVEDAHFHEGTPERRAFRKHLDLVAKALHEIEWADSGDTEPGDRDTKAILRCITRADVLEEAIREAEIARDTLAGAVAAAKGELR
jgi:hypothetical protein